MSKPVVQVFNPESKEDKSVDQLAESAKLTDKQKRDKLNKRYGNCVAGQTSNGRRNPKKSARHIEYDKFTSGINSESISKLAQLKELEQESRLLKAKLEIEQTNEQFATNYKYGNKNANSFMTKCRPDNS